MPKQLVLHETKTAVPIPDRMVDSADEMLRCVHEVLSETERAKGTSVQHWLHEAKPEVLGERVKTVDAKEEKFADYELRFTEKVRWMVDGVIGRVTPHHFKGMIRSALVAQLAKYTGLFPGTWRICAVKAVEGHKNKWRRVPTGTDWAGSSVATVAQTLASTTRAQANAQMTKPQLVPQRQLVLHIAMVEVQQHPPTDPLYNDPQSGRNNQGPMFRYAESGGMLRYLSPKDTDKRNNAKELIAWYYADDWKPKKKKGGKDVQPK